MSGLAAERRMNIRPAAMQMKPSSSGVSDVHRTVGTRIGLFDGESRRSNVGYGRFRGTLRLTTGIVSVREAHRRVGVTQVQKLAENFVLEDLAKSGDEDEPRVETEDLGQVIRRAQFSGHVKRRRKEAPNDILHNLAKAVAVRVASENLNTDEEVMNVVNETGLRVDVRSMNMVVWQLGQMQNWHAAIKVFRAFRSGGVEPNAYVCTTLIAALG